MKRTTPRRVARSIRKRGWNTSNPRFRFKLAAAMCSCLGFVRAQYQVGVVISMFWKAVQFIGLRSRTHFNNAPKIDIFVPVLCMVARLPLLIGRTIGANN